MSSFDEEQARNYMHKLLSVVTEAGSSDLFIASDVPPSMNVHGHMLPLTKRRLQGEVSRQLVEAMMNKRQHAEFEQELECNFAISIPGLSRFHQSVNCLVTHREVGVDTRDWHNALKDAPRQAPAVILIGEIRDTQTMEYAIAFSETGHFCLGTLHANSANQAMDRIVNFFPDERRNQLLIDLSANLRAIVSQRLVRAIDGKGR